MKKYILLVTIMILSACASGPVGNKNVPQPAKQVDIEKYSGLWYEIARYENRFEKGCENVTAEYAAADDGKISVLNTCNEQETYGKKEIAQGKAKIVPDSDNAKLKVSFFGPLYVGNYWVLDHADDYSWSIVGEPSGRYLWILARDATPGAREKSALFKRAQDLGYDLSILRETRQDAR